MDIIEDHIDNSYIEFDSRHRHRRRRGDWRRGGDCFIATAVYGDVNIYQVQILKDFRDNVLRQSPRGRAFINFYDSGAGKIIADFIKENLPSTIPAIRKRLDFLVEKYIQKKVFNNSLLTK